VVLGRGQFLIGEVPLYREVGLGAPKEGGEEAAPKELDARERKWLNPRP